MRDFVLCLLSCVPCVANPRMSRSLVVSVLWVLDILLLYPHIVHHVPLHRHDSPSA